LGFSAMISSVVRRNRRQSLLGIEDIVFLHVLEQPRTLDDRQGVVAPDRRHPVDDGDRLHRRDRPQPDRRAMHDGQLNLLLDVISLEIAIGVGRPFGERDPPRQLAHFCERLRYHELATSKRDVGQYEGSTDFVADTPRVSSGMSGAPHAQHLGLENPQTGDVPHAVSGDRLADDWDIEAHIGPRHLVDIDHLENPAPSQKRGGAVIVANPGGLERRGFDLAGHCGKFAHLFSQAQRVGSFQALIERICVAGESLRPSTVRFGKRSLHLHRRPSPGLFMALLFGFGRPVAIGLETCHGWRRAMLSRSQRTLKKASTSDRL
jgi:hypothetical protein